MSEGALQEKIRLLQEKYAALLTQAAQEGRVDEIPSLSEQMQREIQSLVQTETQSILSSSAIDTTLDVEEEDDVEEDPEGGEDEDQWEEDDIES